MHLDPTKIAELADNWRETCQCACLACTTLDAALPTADIIAINNALGEAAAEVVIAYNDAIFARSIAQACEGASERASARKRGVPVIEIRPTPAVEPHPSREGTEP